MKTRAMIRHPLLAASLGAAVVALPASALYLYGSGHTAKAAGTSAVVASAAAPSAAPPPAEAATNGDAPVAPPESAVVEPEYD